jgi:hypothetical protein
MPEKPPKVFGRRGLRPKVYVCRKALAYPHGGRKGTLHMLALANMTRVLEIKYVTA